MFGQKLNAASLGHRKSAGVRDDDADRGGPQREIDGPQAVGRTAGIDEQRAFEQAMVRSSASNQNARKRKASPTDPDRPPRRRAGLKGPPGEMNQDAYRRTPGSSRRPTGPMRHKPDPFVRRRRLKAAAEVRVDLRPACF
jgi:hypothetical protein